MKIKALIKDTFAEIWATRNRFLSIFAIIALGTGFFAGIKATCPDMIATAQKYFEHANLMDIQIKSTMGFTQSDIEELENLKYTNKVQPAYSVDVFVNTDESSDIVRVYSIDSERCKNDPEYINIPSLKEGRLPESPNECVIDNGLMSGADYNIGDKITLTADEATKLSDSLAYDTFTVVGFVDSAQYISFERGKSSIGNGVITSFIYVPLEAFTYEVYTDVFITFTGMNDVTFDDPEYETRIDGYIEKLEAFADIREKIRYEEVTGEASQKIADAEAEISANEADARAEIEKARTELNEAEAEINRQADDAERTFAETEAQLAQAQHDINQNASDIKTAESAANASLAGITATFPLSASSQAAFDDIRLFAKQNPSLADDLKILKRAQDIQTSLSDPSLSAEERAALTDELTQLSPEIVRISASAAYIEYTNVKCAALVTALYQQSITDTNIQQSLCSLSFTLGSLDYARDQLNAAQQQLNSNKTAFEQAKTESQAQIADARTQITDARNVLNEKEQEASAKIADARADVDEAKKELSELENPSWYIFDRSNNPGYSSFEEDAERVDKIAAVFPVFFILVAMLVCLTTMTRMVEEQRMQIGTLKALGYSRALIMMKYLSYAALASILGSAVGLTIGFKLFPMVIFKAYQIMYNMPDIIAPFKWGFALICTLVAVLCTTLASFSVCYKELFETPAALMRPKSPKAGKTVLIERVSFLWNRLSFLHKVTARNLFRYKKRILMTVVGVAGCTALMFTGFGLQYAITEMVDLQYGNIFTYDVLGVFESKLNTSVINDIDNMLGESKYLSSSELISQHTVSICTDSSEVKREVYLLIPEDTDKLSEYIKLQTRVGKEAINITDEGIVIVEKIAKLYDVNVGDTIRLYTNDYSYKEIPITAITENYTLNYIYMSSACYEQYFGEAPTVNAFYAKMNDTDKESELSTELLQNDNILALSYASEGGGKFRDIVKSLNYIVVVIIICAGALAFVVLYNLANINVTERRREIATIKVLGFYDKEVSAYINRENTVSSLIGIFAGLFLGIPLEKFVIANAEVDSVMFLPNVPLSCYIYAVALTFVFALIVNFTMAKQLKKVDMVESLKSVE